MLATKIVCPHCRKALKTTKPLAVGKRVLCKQCGTTFTVCPTDVTTNTPFPVKQAAKQPPVLPTAIAAAPAPVIPVAVAALDDEPITTEVDGGHLMKLAV